MIAPKKRDTVQIKKDAPVDRDWRSVEAVVLDAFEHPKGVLKLELQKGDGQKGIVDAEFTVVVMVAPPEEPKKLPVATEMWISWARYEILRHQEEINRLEAGIREHGGEP